MRRAHVLFLVSALASDSAFADEPPASVWNPPKAQTLLTPDARRFLDPPALAYWAGTERTLEGELSLAAPRAPEGVGLLPALDDHLSTTTYLRAATAVVRHGVDANVLELSSVHDIRGGAVLGVGFRFDAREQSAVQGTASLTLPLPARLWLVPTLGFGANTEFAPQVLVGSELRSDRGKAFGYSVGFEASSWTDERARVLGTAGAVYRVSRGVALEERVGLGAWAGGGVSGDVAMRWITAALQTLGGGMALYERVTLARGPAAREGAARPTESALSADLAAGVRRSLGPFGVSLQLDEGGQQGTYERWGGELTVYGTLF
jgi:hypothetical protein